MKTIAILGGMSAESTVLYYQTLTRSANAHLGGNRSIPVLIDSIDFEDIASLQRAGDWQGAGEYLARRAARLEAMGADILLLATNTMHKVAPAIEAALSIPFLHIADATAAALNAQNIKRAGLIGTTFTMQDGFYHARMATHGIDILTPDPALHDTLHRIIFEELCKNRIEDASRRAYRQAVRDLQAQGAQGIILGCTEISLILSPEDSALPLFDSAQCHALAALETALADNPSPSPRP